MFPTIARVAATAVFLAAPGLLHAQDPASPRDNAVMIATEVESLMADLEARAADFPEVLAALAEGKARIEDAEETVESLIQRLTEVTDTMEDGSNFDNAIDDYKDATIDLIARGEASENEVIRAMVPDLRTTLEQLEQNDQNRNQTVVEARNVIQQLRDNQEAITFFIEAGEVQRGAALIQENITEFDTIVDRARGVANSLLEAANQ